MITTGQNHSHLIGEEDDHPKRLRHVVECHCKCGKCSIVFDKYEDEPDICPGCKVVCHEIEVPYRKGLNVQVYNDSGVMFWIPRDVTRTKRGTLKNGVEVTPYIITSHEPALYEEVRRRYA